VLTNLELDCPRAAAALPLKIERLAQTFPDLPITCAPPTTGGASVDVAERPAVVTVLAPRWRNPSFDLRALDAEVAARLEETDALGLRVVDDGDSAYACVATALEVVTRFQRLLGGRNRWSDTPLFDRVLAAHRGLHDLGKPLVAADYDHAVDTWRWVLRLAPEASLEVQIAALFHDVERLVSESDRRIEQHASDYVAFKQAHAAAGARLAANTLRDLGAGEALPARVEALVAQHERPDAEPERQLLNDADALSFFSLNACGFLAYYGPEHTRRKVVYTLARLSPRAFLELASVRLSAEIAALVDDALSGAAAPATPGAEAAAT
jgi:hypothetical protein